MIRWTFLLLALIFFAIEARPFGLENYDGFELLVASLTASPAHSPGYSVYLFCIRIFSEILGFFGIELALATVFFNFVCFLFLVILLKRMTRRFDFDPFFIAFSLLCFPPLFQNMLQVEVYVFDLLLMIATLSLYFEHKDRSLLFFLVAGLWVSHRSVAILPLLPFLIVRFSELKGLQKSFSLFILLFPILQLLWLAYGLQSSSYGWLWPASSQPGLSGAWAHFSGSMYSGSLAMNLPGLRKLAQMWFSLGIVLGLMSSLLIFLPRHRRWKPFLFAFCLSLAFPLFYQVPDLEVFLIVPFCLLILCLSPSSKSTFTSVLWVLPMLLLFSLLIDEEDVHSNYFYRASEQKVKDARAIKDYGASRDQTVVFAAYDSVFALLYINLVIAEQAVPFKVFPLWSLYDKAHFLRTKSIVNRLERDALGLPAYSSESGVSEPALHLQKLEELVLLNQDKELLFPGDKAQVQYLLRESRSLHQKQIGSFCNGFWIRFARNLPMNNPLSFIYLGPISSMQGSRVRPVVFQFAWKVDFQGYELEIQKVGSSKVLKKPVPRHFGDRLSVGLSSEFSQGDELVVRLKRTGENLGQSILILD